MSRSTRQGMIAVLNCLVLVSPPSGEYLQVMFVKVVKSTRRKRLGQQKRNLLKRLSSKNRSGWKWQPAPVNSQRMKIGSGTGSWGASGAIWGTTIAVSAVLATVTSGCFSEMCLSSWLCNWNPREQKLQSNFLWSRLKCTWNLALSKQTYVHTVHWKTCIACQGLSPCDDWVAVWM